MTSKTKKLKEKAEAFLSTIEDVDREIIAVNDLSDLLNTQREDAKWSGDTVQIGKIRYALMVNNHKRKALLKHRKKIGKETE